MTEKDRKDGKLAHSVDRLTPCSRMRSKRQRERERTAVVEQDRERIKRASSADEKQSRDSDK